MKLSHRNIITAFLLTFSVAIFGQKQSKTFKETFNVNKDATVEIEALHADINVTTWSKNEVSVEATIEIDGLSKKEAEKYLKNFHFEALGNSNKVKISAGGVNSFRFGDNDFVIFGNNGNFVMPDIVMPEINIPNFDFEMPDIVIPDFDFEIPNIDFGNIFIDLDDIEFDFDEYSKNGKNYFFKWKDSVRDITIKSKKDWEKFKKSKEYKEWKSEMKKNNEKIKKELAKAQKELQGVNSKAVKEALQKARIAIKEVDMEKINKDLAKVKEEFRKNFKSNFTFDSDSNEMTIDGKKVKITKKIVIKVPKGVTLDLDTKHCKLKLPKMSASGKVSYGTFNSKGLDGGDLNIYYSPVQITAVNNSNLNLKNVTDATLASVTNSKLVSDSSDLEILELQSDTNLESTFGDVMIKKVNPLLKNFKLILNQSDATINLVGFKEKLKIDTKGNKGKIVGYDRVADGGKGMLVTGSFQISTKGEELTVSGKYSELTIKE